MRLSTRMTPALSCLRGLSLVSAALLLGSCAHDIQGPVPHLLSVGPSVACSVEVATQVVVGGSGFSPVMARALTLEPQAQMPVIRLERLQDLDGLAASGSVDVPDDPTRIEASDVQWRDAEHMSFWVCPAGTCSAATPPRIDYNVDPGIYGVKVSNPDGRSAAIANALTVVPPPDVHTVVPEVPCSDRPETLVLTGDWLLRVGGQGGTLRIGDKTLTPDLSDCRTLPKVAGPTVEACKTATLSIPKGMFSPGIYDMVWAGPTGAACHSTTALRVTFVPEPSVTQLPTDLVSIAGREATVTVVGSGFLSVANGLPVLVLDATHEVVASSVAQCEAVSGPTQKVWRCKQLTAILPKDFAAPGNYSLRVRNPAPADATSATSATLTVAAPPELQSLGSEVTCDAQMDREITLKGKGFLTVDGQTPTARIGEGPWTSTSAVTASCAAVPGARPGIRQCSQLRLTVGKGSLAAGTYPVEVTNPLPADTTSTALELTVVPAPGLTAVDLDVACAQQAPVQVLLSGEGFLDVDGQMPTIAVGGQTLAQGKVVDTSCISLSGPSVPTRRCTQLGFVLPQGALSVGKHQIVVHNPAPADCASDSVDLTIVAPPHVALVQPDVQCASASQQTVTLSGEGFLTIDGQLPKVTLGSLGAQDATVVQSSCVKVPGVSANVQLCTKLQLNLAKTALSPDNYAIGVENPPPVGCTSAPADLTIVPAPTLESLDTDLRCNAQGGVTLKLKGKDFYTVAGKAPAVQIGPKTWSTTSAVAASCTPVVGPSQNLQRCTELTLALPEAALAPGQYPVSVANALPGDCGSGGLNLTIVAPPSVASVTGDLLCNAEGDVTVQLKGLNFMLIGDAKPTVKVGTSLLPVSDASGCVAVAGTQASAQQCTALSVTVPKGTLSPGSQALSVINPMPAGCVSTEARTLTVLGPPVLTVATTPKVCVAQGSGSVGLAGSGFLRYGTTLPMLKIGGQTFSATAASGCTPLSVSSGNAQVCTGLTAALPVGALALGTASIHVQNPAPAGCQSLAGVTVQSTPPPTLSTVKGSTLCQSGGTLNLTGTHLDADLKVSLGATAAQTVAASGTTATATFGALSGGPNKAQAVTVSNQDGCSATLDGAVTVLTPATMYLVDPPIVHASITTDVALYVAGQKNPALSVTISPSGKAGAPIALQLLGGAKAGKVRVAVPKGIAAGVYDVALDDGGPCPVVVNAGLRVVDGLAIAVTAISPAFGASDAATDLRVSGSGFEATPRIYLAPAGATVSVAPLGAIGFVDAATLSSLAPAGLAAGLYDVLVVNPDGTAGSLAGGFRVASSLPNINALHPTSVPATGSPTLTILGSHFATGPGAATVTLACLDGAGASIGAAVPASTGATTECPAASAGCIGIAVPTASLGAAVTCSVRVSNPTDSTYADYAGLVLNQPNAALGALQAGPPLNAARRGHGAAVARSPSGARYVYAVGGEAGSAASALASVEAAAVDATGKLGTWRTLTFGLPAPRAWSGVTGIGNAIYVVGGQDALSVKADVLRAFVLDEQQIPRLGDNDFQPGNGDGIGAGTWSYRVSAVMAAGDVANPGGETLASQPTAAWIPDFAGKVRVTLTWKALAGAASYRIYRTPLANLATGAEQLLATVVAPATSYTDNGSSTTPAQPLVPGSTTQWQSIASLATARAGAALGRVSDPADPTLSYLYAIGGMGAAGKALTSIELLRISTVGTNQNADAAWTAQTSSLGANRQRWQLGAWALSHDNALDVPSGKAYLYAGGGVDETGNLIKDVDAFAVLPTGKLGVRLTVTPLSGAGLVGYGAAALNNTLLALGGIGAAGSSPSAAILGAKVCGAVAGSCLVPAPGLPTDAWYTWPSAALAPATAWAASAQDGALVFLCGGATIDKPATTQTWSAVW